MQIHSITRLNALPLTFLEHYSGEFPEVRLCPYDLHPLLNLTSTDIPENWLTSSDIYCTITLHFCKPIVHLLYRVIVFHYFKLGRATLLKCAPLDSIVYTGYWPALFPTVSIFCSVIMLKKRIKILLFYI